MLLVKSNWCWRCFTLSPFHNHTTLSCKQWWLQRWLSNHLIGSAGLSLPKSFYTDPTDPISVHWCLQERPAGAPGGGQKNAAGGDSWNDTLPHDCMIQKDTCTSSGMSITSYCHPSPHLCYNATYTLWSPVCKVVPVAFRNTPSKQTGKTQG